MGASLNISCVGNRRTAHARAWLRGRLPSEELLIIGATSDAANELTRSLANEKGAVFGWHRLTLPQLCAALARQILAESKLAPISRAACKAVVARVVQDLVSELGLGRYANIAELPGFTAALSDVLTELRLAKLAPGQARLAAPEVATILERYQAKLTEGGFADWSNLLELATKSVTQGNANRLLGLPTLFLDVPIAHEAEYALVAALCSRAPEILVTIPAADERTQHFFRARMKFGLTDLDTSAPDQVLAQTTSDGSLLRLQRRLFREDDGPLSRADDEVVIFSAPGEGRECAEIARRVLDRAAQGVPFDGMSVLLRSPEQYRSHLEEAFTRAGIPAYFAKGTVRPDPSGRAFCVLLSCAVEGLSARRFAEYLSLAQVPDASAEGTPPDAKSRGDRWVAPDIEFAANLAGETPNEEMVSDEDNNPKALANPVVAGQLRAPRRWENLLVEAAVIGGRERWHRRIEGLRNHLRARITELGDENEAMAAATQRTFDDLDAFAGYALPLIDALDALPNSALWGDWLDSLGALATRALRYPDRVLAVLSELAPMAPVGPVALSEVLLVLGDLLLTVAVPPTGQRYGRVFIAPIEAARGLSFDTVFVPGLVEKVFPKKIAEEPILLDAVRRQIGAGLPTNPDRIASERLALSIAAGAAERRLYFSYPRINLEQGRPRVPSFYGLELIRAAEGRLPNFAELAAKAETATASRLGWPAPIAPAAAIDDAEYDLAILQQISAFATNDAGAARYILTSNPYVARALRTRYQRWSRRWSSADGLLSKSHAVKAVMAKHRLAARAYSATALQNFASCPYRFYLHAIHKLAPREIPEEIDALDPLQRGSLIHSIQFGLFERLAKQSLLPVRPKYLEKAWEILDSVIAEQSAQAREDLAPAIERVWQDGIAAIRADLREWLRLAGEDDSGYVPWRFELSFGIGNQHGPRAADPGSVSEPVETKCGIRLRGSIDLVETHPNGSLRITDHKTGKARTNEEEIICGGKSLQPVLYALAAEKLFGPRTKVESGRLYFCTYAGNFAEHVVPLDRYARKAASRVAKTIDEAVSQPFLPAAPDENGCDGCDYRPVCGPYEERRVPIKPTQRLDDLMTLRDEP